MASTLARRLFRDVAWLALVAAGCVGSERSTGGDGPTASATPAPPASSAESIAHDGPRSVARTISAAPVQIDIARPRGAPVAGGALELDVTIERRLPSTAPMVLEVEVPAGARLVEGRSVELVTDRATRVTRRLELALDSVPERDLVVRLDVQGGNFGAHAEAAYRFGRPEPKLPDVPRVARPIELYGGSLGQPVKLDPPTRPPE